MIHLTASDQGHKQLANWCRSIETQTLPTQDRLSVEDDFACQGKVLRMNLDGDIPDDNPEFDGARSPVYRYGQRDAQGLHFAPDGTLCANEHGLETDAEINVTEADGNYGWPHVAGRQDDNFYPHARLSEASEPCDELDWFGPSQGSLEVVPPADGIRMGGAKELPAADRDDVP